MLGIFGLMVLLVFLGRSCTAHAKPTEVRLWDAVITNNAPGEKFVWKLENHILATNGTRITFNSTYGNTLQVWGTDGKSNTAVARILVR